MVDVCWAAVPVRHGYTGERYRPGRPSCQKKVVKKILLFPGVGRHRAGAWWGAVPRPTPLSPDRTTPALTRRG